MVMAKIKVTQVKSSIKKPKTQKRTLEALGLRKIGQVVEHENSPNILGMINKVKHLVSTQEA
jgi:large subunit ribosomal protein L30